MILAYFHISPNLPKFIELHPNLHVEIEFEDKRVDLVAEGYDLALRYRPYAR